ncbi:MAG: putative lipoic acid-binding regulatory protein [Psychromonas sp.]|jgi:putative lipoic acid-binding regulatory protein|uniref:DUF493 family protein YbeD n=1 Tax=Psychromonas sp. TaxID=1884585 RepID=UPI0039E46957
MALNTTFDTLLEFPCLFTFKVMGVAKAEFMEQVLAVIQEHAPGDYAPTIKPSSKGNYCALSIPVTVTSKEHIEMIYTKVSELELVRHIL